MSFESGHSELNTRNSKLDITIHFRHFDTPISRFAQYRHSMTPETSGKHEPRNPQHVTRNTHPNGINASIIWFTAGSEPLFNVIATTSKRVSP
jgi:hypothetical protein